MNAATPNLDERFVDVVHEMDRIHSDVASPGFEDADHTFHDASYSTPKQISTASPSSSSTRTRHCSSNSSASLDSAIGDLSWTHTPKTNSDTDFSPVKNQGAAVPTTDHKREGSMFTDALFPTLETPQFSPQKTKRQPSVRRSRGLQSQADDSLPLEVKAVCDDLYANFCSSFR